MKSLYAGVVYAWAPRILVAALVGCSGEDVPADGFGTITTVAGTGQAAAGPDGLKPTETDLYLPIQVVFDQDDRPLIVDWNNHRVRTILSQRMITVLGTGFEGISEPNSLTITFSVHHPFQFHRAPDGQIYFAGYHDPRIFRIDAREYVRLVAGNGSSGNAGDGLSAELAFIGAPTGVAVAQDGTVYLSDEAYHRVRRVEPDGTIRHVAGTSTSGYSGDGGLAKDAALYGPTRLAVGVDGSLFIADTLNHAIRRIDLSGIISTVAGNGTAGYSGDGGLAVEASLSKPVDVAVAPDGGLFIADSFNHAIRFVDAGGIIITVAGTGAEGFSGDGGPAAEASLKLPHGVSIASDGSLWIADSANHRVRRIERPR